MSISNVSKQKSLHKPEEQENMIKRIPLYTPIALFLILSPLTSFADQPIVEHLSWGCTKVMHQGKVTSFKDVILAPNGAFVWNWAKTGTLHVPGIQISDLQSFIDKADIFILSQGMKGVLKVHPDTIPYLKKKGKEVYQLLSPQAVGLYNRLVKQNKKVALILHSTC